jgi:putative transposase
MPRLTRLFLPDVPLHIVQRGHDRQAVFVQPRDYQYYLDNIAEAKADLSVQLYAYCLMTNHVHLIVAPDEDVSNISKFMRIVAARQTRYVNKLENRTGTLWEGRFKASLIDSEAYLLACSRYVDLNPVRAAMVAAPQDYEWSSFRSHAAMERTNLVDDHPIFHALGRNSGARGKAYREFVSHGIVDEELDLIRIAVQRNQLTGNRQFHEAIANRTGRRVPTCGRGRPTTSVD